MFLAIDIGNTNITLGVYEAEQLAAETGMKVVTGLLTHSTTTADGPAPDYLSMMRHNASTIVDALK